VLSQGSLLAIGQGSSPAGGHAFGDVDSSLDMDETLLAGDAGDEPEPAPRKAAARKPHSLASFLDRPLQNQDSLLQAQRLVQN